MADQNQMLSTWSQYLDGATQGVSDFYASVEAAMKRRNLPNVEFKRINMKEGGMFSSSREYLRVKHNDLHYDICGAPYANGFFVSSRLFSEERMMDAALTKLSEGGTFSKLVGAATAVAVGAGTYYKIDTAKMFLLLSHQALLDAVDEISKNAHLPLLESEDRRPILQDFFN